MIDISEMMYDPDFTQDFIVYRKSGYWSEGNIVQSETALNFYGIVIPADVKDIEQIPEGDRARGVMAFWSDQEIYVTHNEPNFKGTSDEIEWSGDRYRIYQTHPFNDFGYWKAIGVRMAGD